MNFVAAFLIFQMGAVLVMLSSVFQDILEYEKTYKSPSIAVIVARLGYYAAIIAILLVTLFAILGKFGKLECQERTFLTPDVRNALDVPKREVLFEAGVTFEWAAGVIGVKQREAERQSLSDLLSLREFFEFYLNKLDLAGSDHEPHFFAINGKNFDRFPRRSAAASANELYRIENTDFALRVVHHPDRTVAPHRKQSSDNHTRITLGHKFFLHDFKRLFGGADHFGGFLSQVERGKYHQRLRDQYRYFHSPSLASASELDRILREGLRGREG